MSRVVLLFANSKLVRSVNPCFSRVSFKEHGSLSRKRRWHFGVDYDKPLTEKQLRKIANALALRFNFDGCFEVSAQFENAENDDYEGYGWLTWESGKLVHATQFCGLAD